MNLIDIKLEKQVLGVCLNDSQYIQHISPNLFTTWREEHVKTDASQIAIAILAVFYSGKDVDVLSVDKALQDSGHGDSTTRDMLKALSLSVTRRYNPHNAITTLSELAERRLHCANGSKLIEMSNDSTKSLDDIRAVVEEEKKATVVKKPTEMKTAVLSTIELIDERCKNGGQLVGLSTGYKELDNMTLGLQRKQLIVLAARPSCGKSSLAFNIAFNVAKQNKKVLIFVYEGDSSSVTIRMLSSSSKIDSKLIQRGALRNDQWQKVKEKGIELAKYKIFIEDDSSYTINNIRQVIQRLSQSEGVDLVIADHLHLIPSHNSKLQETQLLDEITQKSKAIAKDFDVPFLLVTQLNRGNENRTDKRPVLKDLRGSGSIEQNSDQVLFIYRDAYYNDREHASEPGPAEIIIAKNRNGNIGTVHMEFVPSTTTFREIETEDTKKKQAEVSASKWRDKYSLYNHLSFEQWPYSENSKDKCLTFLRNEQNLLLLLSESKQPKMHAMMGIVKRSTLNGNPVTVVRWEEIKSMLIEKNTYDLMNENFIVISDCHQNNGFERWSDSLLHLLRERNESKKKTVIVGNETAKDWINLFQTVQNKKEVDEMLTSFTGSVCEVKK